MRTCARCHVAKPVDEFPMKNEVRGTRRSYCRPCCREYGREHYAINPDYYKAKATLARTRDRSANRAIVDVFLAGHPCIDCGETDPVVLDFDHIDPGLKLGAIGRLQHSRGRLRLLAEMDKCEIRCGNCHRRRTARQFGWYRVLLGVQK